MHRQHFSGFFRFVIGTFGPRQITLSGTTENPMERLAMEAIARIYLPLLRKWKWPRVNIAGFARSFGDALELYRRALSAAYVTALSFDQRIERHPDDDLEGRDPRW
jgi:hypothetical protein